MLGVRAARAGAQARLEAEKSERVADFLTRLLVDLDPLESLGGKTSARDLLDGGAARLAGLADQPEVEARLEDAIGRAYWSLGDYERAFELAQRALATRTRLLGPDALETSRSRHLVGQVRCSLEQCEEGSAEMLAALATLRRAAGVERNRRQEDRSMLAVTPLLGLSWILHDQGRCGDAQAPLQEALAISRSQQLDQDDYPAAFLRSIEASCLAREGRRDEAAALFERSLPRLAKRMPNAPETVAAQAWRNALGEAHRPTAATHG